MADDTASHTLAMLRRMDEKLDRVLEDVGDMKLRMTLLETRMAQLEKSNGNLYESLAVVGARVDRIDARLARMERRLDLAEAPQ